MPCSLCSTASPASTPSASGSKPSSPRRKSPPPSCISYRPALSQRPAPLRSAGAGRTARRTCRDQRAASLWGKLSSILAVRFRGYDPDRLLTWLNRYFGWLFSLPALAGLLLMLSALLLIGAEFEVFRSRLPDFREFFAARIGSGSPHALRHQNPPRVRSRPGLQAVRRRVPRDGADAAGLHALPVLQRHRFLDDPQQWRRAAVGAAGMYIELILASLATFLWWYTRAGTRSTSCAST